MAHEIPFGWADLWFWGKRVQRRMIAFLSVHLIRMNLLPLAVLLSICSLCRCQSTVACWRVERESKEITKTISKADSCQLSGSKATVSAVKAGEYLEHYIQFTFRWTKAEDDYFEFNFVSSDPRRQLRFRFANDVVVRFVEQCFPSDDWKKHNEVFPLDKSEKHVSYRCHTELYDNRNGWFKLEEIWWNVIYSSSQEGLFSTAETVTADLLFHDVPAPATTTTTTTTTSTSTQRQTRPVAIPDTATDTTTSESPEAEAEEETPEVEEEASTSSDANAGSTKSPTTQTAAKATSPPSRAILIFILFVCLCLLSVIHVAMVVNEVRRIQQRNKHAKDRYPVIRSKSPTALPKAKVAFPVKKPVSVKRAIKRIPLKK